MYRLPLYQSTTRRRMKFFYFLAIFLQIIHLKNAIIPPKNLPEELLNEYTLNGTIPVARFYVDDTMKGNDTHFTYPRKQIDSFVTSASKLYQRFEILQKKMNVPGHSEAVPSDLEKALIFSLPKHHWVQYSFFLYRHFISNASIVVIGSMEPWIEASLLALGAKMVVTLEYNKLTYDHPQLITYSKQDFDSFYSNSSNIEAYDMVISMSAFDHDGLGRYGDPLNPSGDLQSMQKMAGLLKIGTGRLFLSVPIGADVLVWNLHRRYGPIRLPLLLEAYDIIDRIGWDQSKLNEDSNWRQTYEPIFVLSAKNPLLTPILNDEAPHFREEL